MFTFQDAIDHLSDYLGAGIDDAAQRDCRRAVLAAYRDLANAHRWTYLYTHGRVSTNAPFSTGTLSYDQSDGTYPREATIAGGTWPEWAANGYLKVGPVVYRVAERKSATKITLHETLNPGGDLPPGTGFTLYRDTYLLPADFIASDEALYQNSFGGMTYVHPREWLFEQRHQFTTGDPLWFTVTGDGQYPGRLVFRVWPVPDFAKTIDFLYHRRPRPLTVTAEQSGTVSIVAGTGAVSGSNTAFTPGMVGSVIRLAANASRPPTSLVGNNPAVIESVITGHVSLTGITIADPAGVSYANVRYSVSDPIDIEEGAMLNAFLRGCETQMAINRTLKDKPSAFKQYEMALREAKAADSRTFTGRAVGDLGSIPRWPDRRFMPVGPDQ
ncbi:MAG: hypothetical protein IRY99_07930 [Isosphaeraceae bacterium]|nr:hypothetical protein [Isosphaeraceae bacterium]